MLRVEAKYELNKWKLATCLNVSNIIKMEKYNRLINALQVFEEDWLFDTGITGSRESLNRQKNEARIDVQLLKKEFEEVFLDKDFDWKLLANKSGLFSDIELYDDWHIRAIIEYYLYEFLYPTSELTIMEREMLSERIKFYLSNENKWISVKDLLRKLRIEFPKVKPYHFFCYKDYFSINLICKRINNGRLWIVDEIKLDENIHKA